MVTVYQVAFTDDGGLFVEEQIYPEMKGVVYVCKSRNKYYTDLIFEED